MKSKAKLQGRKAQIEEIKRKQQKLNMLTHQVSMLKKMTTSCTKSQNTTIPCKSKFILIHSVENIHIKYSGLWSDSKITILRSNKLLHGFLNDFDSVIGVLCSTEDEESRKTTGHDFLTAVAPWSQIIPL